MQVENSLESVNLKRLNDAMRLAKEQLYGLSEERKTIYWVSMQNKLKQLPKHHVSIMPLSPF